MRIELKAAVELGEYIELVQDISELPDWFNAKKIYIDFETTSGDSELSSLNVWRNCNILGIAIVVDDAPTALYIPLRHRVVNGNKNLDPILVFNWLRKVFAGAECWINHNIKYDAHALLNDEWGIDWRQINPKLELIDTLALCKLAPRTEEFTYELTSVMRKWCYVDISPFEDTLKHYLKDYRNLTTNKKGSKDYGVVPIDVMAPYAAVDVLSVRKLYGLLESIIPSETDAIKKVEIATTRVLFDIERNGMRVDLDLVNHHLTTIPLQMELLQIQITRDTGYPAVMLHTNQFGEAYFLDKLKLPVLNTTEKGKPSFDVDTLLLYKAQLPQLESTIDKIIQYRELYKLYTGFTIPYSNLSILGILHPDYNQIVRTGRMSCRTPNMQQLSEEAKEYIIPYGDGYVIVDIDYSQIEFRLIAHFIQAEDIIREFNTNPKADYHDMMVQRLHIPRRPAKVLNFMLGYGGGKKKCTAVLSSIPDVVGELKDAQLIANKAAEIYDAYHKMLPSLKMTQHTAMKVCQQRGYVKTLLGRRRYLHYKKQFAAFNTVSQGSAADLFKAALVKLHGYTKNKDIKLIGCVHDSYVLCMPKESVRTVVPEIQQLVTEIPENVNLRVKLRADSKMSEKNWRECA